MDKIELFFACENLPDLDALSKSDPLVIVKQPIDPTVPDNDMQYLEVGRTEYIANHSNPLFKKSVVLDYSFEQTRQPIRIVVYDVDRGDTYNLNDYKIIGGLQFDLSYIVKNKYVKLPLAPGPKVIANKKQPGYIIIRTQPMGNCDDVILFDIKATKLPKKDTFGLSDPYFILRKTITSEIPVEGPFLSDKKEKEDTLSKWNEVYKSEVKKIELNPKWKPFKIGLGKLCSGDFKKPIKFSCYDWDNDGTSDMIGEFTFSLADLFGVTDRPQDDQNVKEKEYKLYEHKNESFIFGGYVKITATYVRNASFLDFLAGGCRLNLIFGIDFAGKKGFHAPVPGGMNEIEWAIAAVGNILSYYDSDKKYPTWGFGVKFPPSYKTNNLFPLNGDFNNSELSEVQGVLETYARFTGRLDPTTEKTKLVKQADDSKMAEMIKWTNEYCKSLNVSQTNQQYVILTIITEGCIEDMKELSAEIIKGCQYPLSIVIVGVGAAGINGTKNNEKMKKLDGDDSVLKSGSKKASRDIVQFVPFKENFKQGIFVLAASCLAEIPGQFLEFMKSKKITPLAAPV